MPLIRLEFDNTKVPDEEVKQLSEAIQKIVVEVTGIEDVFVYANSAQIKVNIAPIEIFVEISASIVKDETELMQNIKNQLTTWKKENNFIQPINLTLIPMNWKFEVGI